jgi:predicted SAM-dependent methyltransferase
VRAKYVNLACGPVFIDCPDWLNLDFVAELGVKQANLLERLPLHDNVAQMLYSSHFLEHIQKPRVKSFLCECLRVLKPGGVLRLVLPDLENMARSYVQLRDSKEHEKANFLVLEMIDQCVRQQSGGELGNYYETMRLQAKEIVSPLNEVTSMIDFIRYRTGEDLAARNQLQHSVREGAGAGEQFKRLTGAMTRRFQCYWTRAIVKLLPPAFRMQNVSLAEVGENHHWLWDFYQLQQALEAVGFILVERRSASTSLVSDFPFYPLDLDKDGKPRKGRESMYIEAIKPEQILL